MVRYECRACNYRFESEFSHEGGVCPYCGEKEVEHEKSAEDILSE